MNISIRKFLLINLLIAITITSTLTAVGNYFLDQKDIQKHLDTFLSEFSYSLRGLLVENAHLHHLSKLQREFDSISSSNKGYFFLRENIHLPYAQDTKYYFQVWQEGRMVLHSANAPNVPLSTGTPGFSDKMLKHHRFRVFTTHDPSTDLTFIVAEPYLTRSQLISMIAHDEMYIVLLTYPISGFLIWFIIGRGLNSIKRVTDEVTSRNPHRLDQVDTEKTPGEIKPLIVALNKLFKRLEEAFEREQRFAADAAHELKTPLAAIRTQAQVALQAGNEEERRKVLDQVISGVDRSTHVVQQLLALSRLTPEATASEETQEITLSTLVEESVAQLVPYAIEKDIEIELDAPEPSLLVRANPTTLSILIRNIVDNAIRYTQEGGHVWVSVTKIKNHAVLKVKDNGPGIPEELRSLVFERFYRVIGSKAPGSGLGLALVKQVATAYKATVEISTPADGHGLEIKIIFPIVKHTPEIVRR